MIVRRLGGGFPGDVDQLGDGRVVLDGAPQLLLGEAGQLLEGRCPVDRLCLSAAAEGQPEGAGFGGALEPAGDVAPTLGRERASSAAASYCWNKEESPSQARTCVALRLLLGEASGELLVPPLVRLGAIDAY